MSARRSVTNTARHTKSGMPIEQLLTLDTATTKGKPNQTLNFKAWLVGEGEMPTPGAFEANTTFQITYL